MSMRQFLFLSLALGGTGLALLYALWGVDFDELYDVLRRGKYAAAVPFVIGWVVFYWLKAQRWAVILAPFGTYSWREVAPAMMIGFASNNVLPGHLGEFVRTWVFSRQTRLGLTVVFVSIVLERIFDVVAIFVFYLAAVLMMDSPPAGLTIGAWTVSLIVFAAWGCILLALLRPALLFAAYDKCTMWLGGSIRSRGRDMLGNVIRALGSLQSINQFLQILAYTLAQWLLPGLLVWLSVWAYGVIISLQSSLVVLAVITLAVTVPSAPGYVGALQAAFVIALVPFGVQREVAVAASVFFLVVHWVPVTLLGAVLFFREGMRASEVQAAMAGKENSGTETHAAK